jgi:hypothetical protein
MRPATRRWTASLALAAALLAVVGGPATARAAPRFDPDTADKAVVDARQGGLDSFCKQPRMLSGRAILFCPDAKQIPECAKYAEECERLTAQEEKKPQRSWLSDFLASLAPLASALVWLLVAAAVGGLVWLVVSAILKGRREAEAAEPMPASTDLPRAAPVEEAMEAVSDAELLLRRADDHARRGELDRAGVMYLAAALRALDRRGAIRIARDRTNGEYVRACKDAGAKPELRAIVREVDRVQFGREAPTVERVADVAGRAAKIVRAAAVAAMTIALLGCNATSGPPPKASDPGGDDLFFALLTKQGADVKRMPTSLASLPLPGEDDITPVVVLDLGRVQLEEETAAHLVRWVEAGGVLITAGHVAEWPESFGAKPAPATSPEVTVTIAPDDEEEEEDEDEEEQLSSVPPKLPPPRAVHLAHAAGLTWEATRLGATSDGVTWAGVKLVSRGAVLGMATDDLLTNAGLARPPNAAALMALLKQYEGRTFQVARPEDGIAPPSNPVSSLLRAGLGLGLVHAAVAGLLLLLAYGVRQARAKPTPPPARRAWTEHLEATGGLYARARLAPHALAMYARFVDGRLRARMPRGTSDPASFLAQRAKADPQRCAALWARATAARSDERARGDELIVLRELSALYAAAMKTE